MICRKKDKGVVLLVVLFVVMAIAVLSLGFMAQSDIELACGGNMQTKAAIDYLVESGLEQGKGMLLSFQDVSGEYYSGSTAQQLVAGSSDYYDIAVQRITTNPKDYCTYNVQCDAYRLKDGNKIARCSKQATMRIDPCFALITGKAWKTEPTTKIYGDVYSDGSISRYKKQTVIYGDAYSSKSISAYITGSKNTKLKQPPIDMPQLDTKYYKGKYRIDKTIYAADVIAEGDHPAGVFNASSDNPAGVRYCDGDVNLPGDVAINGTLVVNGTLTITGQNNTIKAAKNFPALIVKDELILADKSALNIEGLAQIGEDIEVENKAKKVSLNVVGSVVIVDGDIDGAYESKADIEIIAAPQKAAIEYWAKAGKPTRWDPAAGAFFKSITRN